MSLSTSDLNTIALGVASTIMQIALLDEMDPELKVKTAQEMKKDGLPIYWRDVPTEACRVIRENRLGYFKKNLFIGAIYGNLVEMGMNKKVAKEIRAAITKKSSDRATEEFEKEFKAVTLPDERSQGETEFVSINDVNFKRAFKEFNESAKKGEAEAQYALGFMYANGRGVSGNDAEAVKWWRLAADQGHVEAQFDLGRSYAKGEGVPRNGAEAMRWWGLAANQGYAEAQHNLGVIYAKGEGVPANYVLAYMWFNLAAAQGNENGSQVKTILRKAMTTDQIAEAERLSKEWLEEHQ